MANFYKNLAEKLFVIIFLVTNFGIGNIFARKYSPLLIEDDGFRRQNRAAGKFTFIRSVLGNSIYFDFVLGFSCQHTRHRKFTEKIYNGRIIVLFIALISVLSFLVFDEIYASENIVTENERFHVNKMKKWKCVLLVIGQTIQFYPFVFNDREECNFENVENFSNFSCK